MPNEELLERVKTLEEEVAILKAQVAAFPEIVRHTNDVDRKFGITRL